ncbi:TrmB family transcriptional regulator [Halobaculum sp. CBA1158]|uniref:TrmB family transcriptional regulator n=1 Tax=Halobaculum sp. CBA1158 TaxID=2904243 RepID=UPI001F280240|nr:TrmB family transcriptional regulator [Halobaculum sp. CBA1158]UIO99689.1 TrmB family transcriptional regulator [Halobaculum sp. CBA1158]
MNDSTHRQQAVELLQELGLKEYEARSFVALARRREATAKEISDTSEVPRTRVYDAVRVLEAKGLVETQHSNPQVFRAVPIDEAITTLQAEYEQRTESLRDALDELEPPDDEGTEVTHEVWALSGGQGITSRTRQLVDGADREVVIVIGHESVVTPELLERLEAAHDRGVDLLVGAASPELAASIRESLPGIEVFVSGLDWLSGAEGTDDTTEISRLVLTDREAILVSSFTAGPDGRDHELGVFGRGFDNGLVAIVRRLMSTGHGFSGDATRGE